MATVVTGGQYCDADGEPGEDFTLEREPGLTHEPHAVRLENERFEKIGYLPRRIVSWLAPRGSLVQGRTAARNQDADTRVSLQGQGSGREERRTVAGDGAWFRVVPGN